MPRETVTRGDFRVEVGWSPDTDVQLGLRTAAKVKGGNHLITALYDHKVAEIGKGVVQVALRPFDPGDPNYEDIGARMLDVIKTLAPSFDSIWTDLSREEINKLIKVLRRARDAAYGRDE